MSKPSKILQCIFLSLKSNISNEATFVSHYPSIAVVIRKGIKSWTINVTKCDLLECTVMVATGGAGVFLRIPLRIKGNNIMEEIHKHIDLGKPSNG